jgi:hypothetical protein
MALRTFDEREERLVGHVQGRTAFRAMNLRHLFGNVRYDILVSHAHHPLSAGPASPTTPTGAS